MLLIVTKAKITKQVHSLIINLGCNARLQLDNYELGNYLSPTSLEVSTKNFSVDA